MRILWLVGLAACSVPSTHFTPSIFDARPDTLIDAPDAMIDAAPDAPDAPVGPAITTVDQPPRVATGDTVTIKLGIHAQTTGSATWTIHPTVGSFAPTTGTVDLDASGNGTITVSYTAAAAIGDAAYTVDLDDGVTTHTDEAVKVRALVLVGQSTAFADSGGLTVGADLIYGQQVTVSAQAYLMRFGLFVDNAGYSGRLSLYLDHGANPATLVAESSLQTLVAGRNEIRLATPTQLNAGTYWLMGDFNASAQVRRSTVTVAQLYANLSSTAAMPATTAGMSTVAAQTLNYFVEVIP